MKILNMSFPPVGLEPTNPYATTGPKSSGLPYNYLGVHYTTVLGVLRAHRQHKQHFTIQSG